MLVDVLDRPPASADLETDPAVDDGQVGRPVVEPQRRREEGVGPLDGTLGPGTHYPIGPMTLTLALGDFNLLGQVRLAPAA